MQNSNGFMIGSCEPGPVTQKKHEVIQLLKDNQRVVLTEDESDWLEFAKELNAEIVKKKNGKIKMTFNPQREK